MADSSIETTASTLSARPPRHPPRAPCPGRGRGQGGPSSRPGGVGPAVRDGQAQGLHTAAAGKQLAVAQLRGFAGASGRVDGGGIGVGGGAGERADAVAKTGVQIAWGPAASGTVGGTTDRRRGGNLVTRGVFFVGKIVVGSAVGDLHGRDPSDSA